MYTKAQLEEELTTLRATLEELLAERRESVTSAPTEAHAPAKKAPKTAKKPGIPGVRIVKPGAGREVSLPAPVDGSLKGTTFATWIDGGIKRRAWTIPSGLVVDMRGINAEGVRAIAKAWNARAKAPRMEGDLAIFAKAGK